MNWKQNFYRLMVKTSLIRAPIIDLENVLTEKNGKLFLNKILIPDKLKDQLKSEANLYRNTKLWEIITNTLENQAYESGWTKSTTLQDLLNAKSICFTISVQKNIIELIERAK